MVVRIKRASNMIAKWYQKAMPAWPSPPNDRAKIWAMPTAKVGAPPVRPIMECSPTDRARSSICFSVTGNPISVTRCTTAAGSPRRLMAKYSPGGMAQAAIRASTPTHISVIIAP